MIRPMWLRLAVRAWIVVVLATGCSTTGSGKPASTSPRIAGIEFIQAPAFVLAECHSTARQVGYAVPCPRRIPTSLHPLGGTSKCPVAIIGPAGQGGCSHQWRGWVVGSSIAGQEHLVIQAAPTVVVDPAKAIDGPGWYPGATVQLLGTSTIAGQTVKLYDVPPATNDGSAFAG